MIEQEICAFNKSCRNTTFVLQQFVNQIVDTDKKSIEDLLFNGLEKALHDTLLVLYQLHKEWLNMQENDELEDCEVSGLDNTFTIINKLKNDGINVEIAEGADRVAFIFDEFVIKFNKLGDDRQDDAEMMEYINIIQAMHTAQQSNYGIIPVIGYTYVFGLLIGIFPRAHVFDDYQISAVKIKKWLQQQSIIRKKLLGRGLPLNSDCTDLVEDNIGIYRNSLVIFDAGSIEFFLNETTKRNS